MTSRRYRNWSVPKVDDKGADTRDRLIDLGFQFDSGLEEEHRYRIYSTDKQILLQWVNERGYYKVLVGTKPVCYLWPDHVTFIDDPEDPEQ